MINSTRLPSRELTYPQKMAFWRWFSFPPRWDMLIPWRVTPTCQVQLSEADSKKGDLGLLLRQQTASRTVDGIQCAWFWYGWWFRNPAIYQFRLVNIRCFFRFLYIPGGCLEFLPSGVFTYMTTSLNYPLSGYRWNRPCPCCESCERWLSPMSLLKPVFSMTHGLKERTRPLEALIIFGLGLHWSSWVTS